MDTPSLDRWMKDAVMAELELLAFDDIQCAHLLIRGLTCNGPQRDTLRAYAHGIAAQLVPREVACD